MEVVVAEVGEARGRFVPLLCWALQPRRVKQDEGVESWNIRLDASVNDLKQAGEEVRVKVDRQPPHVVQHEREERTLWRC